MASRVDPDGIETRVIHQLIDFRGKDVLEVGCGDGRMTWRFAEHTSSVPALDPDEATEAGFPVKSTNPMSYNLRSIS